MAYQSPSSEAKFVPAISSHTLSFLTNLTETHSYPPPTPNTNFYPICSIVDMRSGCPEKKKPKDYNTRRLPVLLCKDLLPPPYPFDGPSSSSSVAVKVKKDSQKSKKDSLKLRRQKQKKLKNLEGSELDNNANIPTEWTLNSVTFTCGRPKINPEFLSTQKPVALGTVPNLQQPIKSRAQSCPPDSRKIIKHLFVAEICLRAADTASRTHSAGELKIPLSLDENQNEPYSVAKDVKVIDPHSTTHIEDPVSSTTSFRLLYSGANKVFPSRTEHDTCYRDLQNVVKSSSAFLAVHSKPFQHESPKITKADNKDTNKNLEESSSSKSAHWLKEVDNCLSSTTAVSSSLSCTDTSILLPPPAGFEDNEDSVAIDKAAETKIEHMTQKTEELKNSVSKISNILPLQKMDSCQLLYKPKPLPFSESISRQEYPSVSMVNLFKSTFTKRPGLPKFSSVSTTVSETEDEETLLAEIRRSNSLFPVEWIENLRIKWTKLKNWLLKKNQTSGIIPLSPSSVERISARSKLKFVKERSEYMDHFRVSDSNKRLAIPREMYFPDEGEQLLVEEELVPEVSETKEFRRKRYSIIWCDHTEYSRRKYITKDLRPRRIAVRLKDNEE